MTPRCNIIWTLQINKGGEWTTRLPVERPMARQDNQDVYDRYRDEYPDTPPRIKAYVPHTPLRATPPHHTGGLL